MKLTPEQEEALAKDEGYKCSECKQHLSKRYCGRCDEFYNAGHKEGCSRKSERDDHQWCMQFVRAPLRF